MQRLSRNLALTGALAALVWAIPVSIDFTRPSATAPSLAQAIGVSFKIDTAEARVGHPATPRSVAGVARRTMRTPFVGVRVARPVVAGAAVVGTAAATTGAAAATGTVAASSTAAATSSTTATAGLSVTAAAQQPSEAQIGAIRSACRADFLAHCSGVQPGGHDALACLRKNIAALSAGCQKAVSAVGGAALQKPDEAAAAAMAAPPASAGTAAAAPAATLAPTAPTSTGTATARPAIPLGMRLVLLRRACGEDVLVNCPGVRPGGGQLLACLAGNQMNVSPRCRQVLAAARQGMYRQGS
jgi:hypothetical protein